MDALEREGKKTTIEHQNLKHLVQEKNLHNQIQAVFLQPINPSKRKQINIMNSLLLYGD